MNPRYARFDDDDGVVEIARKDEEAVEDRKQVPHVFTCHVGTFPTPLAFLVSAGRTESVKEQHLYDINVLLCKYHSTSLVMLCRAYTVHGIHILSSHEPITPSL